jgi:hypothetical protein
VWTLKTTCYEYCKVNITFVHGTGGAGKGSNIHVTRQTESLLFHIIPCEGATKE